MKIIKHFVESIEDEICGAKEYAEKYVEAKAKGDMSTANRYKEMAHDELKHASFEHEMAVHEIEKLKAVFKPPEDMLEKWEKSHKEYVEKGAWIRQMLEM
jgi:predicted RNA-binding protein with RPS1 domain